MRVLRPLGAPLALTVIAALTAVTAIAALIGIATIASAFAPFGCSSTCSPVERTHPEAGGKVTRSGSFVHYESNPIDGPFLPFDGGSVYHVRHGMGVTPDEYHVTLAFHQSPFAPGGGGQAQGAGNQAVVVHVDAQELVVKNDSCASYWIRIELDAHVGGDGGVSDAAGD